MMKPPRTRSLATAALVCALPFAAAAAHAADPLPSWNEGRAKQSIVEFVQRVTTRGDKDFVPPAERIAVFADGDLQMLQWTAAGGGPRFMGTVHHTDGQREWAYDRESSIGRLDKVLDEAKEKGWVVVSMKKDWKVVYPFEKR